MWAKFSNTTTMGKNMNLITPHTCTRGKMIGTVIVVVTVVVVMDTKIA